MCDDIIKAVDSASANVTFNCARRCLECESVIVISIEILLVCKNKCYLQVYLDNYAYKTVSKQMIDYLDDNLFETNED